MERESRFRELMEQVRAGSDAAAHELVEVYGPYILRVVRRRLHQHLRSKFDSTDFVQAVWASFFAIPHEDRQFDRAETLVAFLAAVARNKVIEAVRQRFQAHEYPLQEPDQPGQADPLRGRQPTPSEVAIAREEWDRLWNSPDDQEQLIVRSRWKGGTVRAIAARLGVSERTIRRILGKFTFGLVQKAEAAAVGETPPAGDPPPQPGSA